MAEAVSDLTEPLAPGRRVLAAALAVGFGLAAAIIVRFQPLTADFPVFYAVATHPAIAYDVHALSAVIGTGRIDAFGYPPPMLWLIRPLALFSLYDAWSVWSGLVTALFAWLAIRKLGPLWGSVCVAASPVFWASITGQLTLLVACLVMMGAYGPAAILKPTTMLLAPALGLRRIWKQVAIGVGLALIFAAVGWHDWVRWFHALPDYMAADAQPFLDKRRLAPFPLWAHLALGGVAVFLAWRARDDENRRMVAVIMGSLLLSPHAFPYDLAVVAPFVMANRRYPPIWVAFTAGAFTAAPALSALLLLAAI